MNTELQIREKIKDFRPSTQKVEMYSPNIHEKSNRIYKFKSKNGNSFRLRIFTSRIQLEIPVKISLLFSINLPDNICLAKKLLYEQNEIGKIFTDNSKDEKVKECIELLRDDLILFKFGANEGLTVYGNWLHLTLKLSRQILPEIEIIEKIKSKIELRFPEIDSNDNSDLPRNFEQLLNKFEKWAISDDFERDEKINEATDKDIKTLIETLELKLREINIYLDSFKSNPLTDGAIKLQNLAELVAELTLNKNKNHS